jgi:hypothetical protein
VAEALLMRSQGQAESHAADFKQSGTGLGEQAAGVSVSLAPAFHPDRGLLDCREGGGHSDRRLVPRG